MLFNIAISALILYLNCIVTILADED